MEVNTKIFIGYIFCQIFVISVLTFNPYKCVKCMGNDKCQPPDCFCCRDTMPLQVKQVPQMVFFTFDDAIAPQVANFYRKLFDSKRKNPNGCPVKMTLFISHANTVYRIVREFYNKGMEIGAHSVSHKNMNKRTFRNEAKRQKENLARKAGIPSSKIKGWRSPFLKPLGDIQPNTLKELGYDYDATLTIGKSNLQSNAPIPFTLDYGWPYTCKIKPCPRTSHKGFWEVPVVTLMDYKEDYECVYVDGCTFPPPNEDAAFRFLWKNFESYYNNNRAPFGINMHASWFYYPDRLRAMDRFIKELGKLNDVYIVSVSQVISWLRQPTPLSQIDSFEPWGCGLKPAKNNLTVAKVKPNQQTIQTVQTATKHQPKQIQQLQQWRKLIPGMSINNRRQETIKTPQPSKPTQSAIPTRPVSSMNTKPTMGAAVRKPIIQKKTFIRPAFFSHKQFGNGQRINQVFQQSPLSWIDLLHQQTRRHQIMSNARMNQSTANSGTARKLVLERSFFDATKPPTTSLPQFQQKQQKEFLEQQRIATINKVALQELATQDQKIEQDIMMKQQQIAQLEEQARIEKQKQAAELHRMQELKRVQEEKRKAEEKRLQEEMRIAELKKQQQEQKRLEELKRIEEQRQLEAKRLAELKLIEAQKLAEEQKRLEELKRIEEAKKAAEQKRLEEEKRLAALQLVEEQKRIAEEERLAELKRIEKENQAAEAKRLAVQKRIAEEKRLAELKRITEQIRLEEEKRLAELKQIEEQKRIEEQQRIAELKRIEEARKAAEQKRLEEEKRIAALEKSKQRNILEQQRAAEERRLEEAKRLKQKQITDQTLFLEQQQIAELQKQEKLAEQKTLQKQKQIEQLKESENTQRMEQKSIKEQYIIENMHQESIVVQDDVKSNIAPTRITEVTTTTPETSSTTLKPTRNTETKTKSNRPKTTVHSVLLQEPWLSWFLKPQTGIKTNVFTGTTLGISITTTDIPSTTTATTKPITLPTDTPFTTTTPKVTNVDNISKINTVVPTTIFNVDSGKSALQSSEYKEQTRSNTIQPTSNTVQSSRVSETTTSQPATSNVTNIETVCTQEVNCFAPNCVCKSESVPGSLNPAKVPQIVYITIDGDMNFLTYSRLRTLFSPYRKNPNGCPIGGTYFTSDRGLSFGLPHLARNGNIEIAMNGMRTTGYNDIKTMANDVIDQTEKLQKRLHLSKTEIKGWRSPGLRNLGDKQFDVLKNMSLYDSSLISSRHEETSKQLWPFTLDYGWNEPCKTSHCPEKFHPGVWEIPIIPMSEHGSKRACIYADSCYNQPSTLQDTYDYLWDNFQTHYSTNKAPFGIHLTQKWFQWYYSHNMSGLLKFLEKVASMEDVYVVSVSQLIEWMKHPTTLSDIKNFVPWKC